MSHAPERPRLCIAAAIAGLAAACAATGVWEASSQGPGTALTPAGQPLAPQAAMARIVLGRSTKADISTALGRAIVIAFDSGYEVWVYRWAGADKTTRGATELVVLFAPSGLATKLRLRPGDATRDPSGD